MTFNILNCNSIVFKQCLNIQYFRIYTSIKAFHIHAINKLFLYSYLEHPIQQFLLDLLHHLLQKCVSHVYIWDTGKHSYSELVLKPVKWKRRMLTPGIQASVLIHLWQQRRDYQHSINKWSSVTFTSISKLFLHYLFFSIIIHLKD